jgi:hypothetical protein
VRKYFHISWLVVLLFITSCEHQTEWNFQEGDALLVVDCIITNELKYHDLRLYGSSDGLNQLPAGITGAAVALDDGDKTVVFNEDTDDPGRYISADPFIATAGKNYRLTYTYNGYSDTAFASMAGVSPLEAAEIAATDGYYRLIYHESSPPSMTEVLYNWSEDAQYCEQYGNCLASEIFYSLDNIDIGKEFPPEKQVILFPHKTEIIRRKYSLSEEHQGFIRSLLLETEWRGGYFDVEQGNIPSNFKHGTRGWFAVCAVVTDTTYFE